MPPTPADALSPIIKKYRAFVVKDKGLAETLLWGVNDDKTRLRIHNVVTKIEPELVLDPEYTRILQRQDMALIELSDAVEALLVAREAVSQRARRESASGACRRRRDGVGVKEEGEVKR